MTTKEKLIEQHIREYESRVKHIDELYERAHKATEHLDDEHDSRSELKWFEDRRSNVKDAIETMPVKNWRKETVKKAGPMAIWDIIAQQLEDFLERHEK